MKSTGFLASLEYVSRAQNGAQNLKRFEGNPYVEGDNIAEHLSRVSRLLLCIASDLKTEFPDKPDLIERVFVTLLLHDDDEIIDGIEIPTAMKLHNVKDEEEISKFEQSVASLDPETQKYFISAFSSFRRKDSLAAKIAKALDNISGNQLVIEQKVGLINPDQARFAIEYVEKVRGISKTVDALIDAQISQIVEGRKWLKEHPDEAKVLIEGLVKPIQQETLRRILDLLEIDVSVHELDNSKINLSLEKL